MSLNSGSKQSSGSPIPQKPPSFLRILVRLKADNGGDGFKEAERELLLMEEHLRNEAAVLREKGDILEGDVMSLKTELASLQNERRVMKRELEVKDIKLVDSARDLSNSRDSEARAMKRYDTVMGHLKSEEELNKRCKFENDMLKEKVRELRDELSEVKGAIEGFEGEKLEFERVVRSRDAEIANLTRTVLRTNEELLKKDERMKVLERENAEFKRDVGVIRAEMLGNRVQLREKDGRIEGLECGNAELEMLVMGGDGKISDLTKALLEKDTRIKELVKNEQSEKGKLIELLGRLDGMEKSIDDLVKEKDRLLREKKQFIVKSDKLKRDVISCMCLNAVKDKHFSSSVRGKIIAGVIDAIEAEDEARVKTSGNILEEDKTAKSKFLSEEEPSGGIMNVCNKNGSIKYIQIDSDEEMPPPFNDLKRERESSVCGIQRHLDGDSSVEIPNQNSKIRKSRQLGAQPVKRWQSIVASGGRDDHKIGTLQKQATATIRKCGENLSRNVEEPGCNYPQKYDVSEAHNTKMSHSPKLKELMAKLMQNHEKNTIECAVDMAWACDKNDEFCAKAICALYRLHNSSSGCKGFEGRDINRLTELAEFLIDGDPNSDQKKSMNDLKQHDPGGLDDCRKFTCTFSEQLFEIFKGRNGDPLFSHLSTQVPDK